MRYKRVLVGWWALSVCLLLAGIAWAKVVDYRMYRHVPARVTLDYPYPWGAGALVLAGFLGLLLVGLTHGVLYLMSKRQPLE